MYEYAEFVEFYNFCKYAETARKHMKKLNVKLKISRRYIRDYSDPFKKHSVQEFYRLYRFTPHAVKNCIIPLLKRDLRKPTKRGMPFPTELMVLVTLRYYATANVQAGNEDLMMMHQPTVSKMIARVSTFIANKMKDYVKFPHTAEGIHSLKQNFYEIAQFPDVIGCIGCTHVRVKSPGGKESKQYWGPKGWYTLKVQAVTGPNSEFLDLVAWPGGTSDVTIYNNSDIRQTLESGALEGILLGHSGYEISNVLLTPFSSPQSDSQNKYNESHSETRNYSVEKAFDIWKKRFPCLLVGMGTKLDRSITVICACAVLHNLSIIINDSFIDDDEMEIEEDDITTVPENPGSEGFILRQSLVDRFYT